MSARLGLTEMWREAEIDRTVDQLSNELALLEPAYEKAKALLEASDWQASEREQTNEILALVESFAPGDSGEKAIAILAEARALARRASGPRRLVADYEERKARLEEYVEKWKPER